MNRKVFLSPFFLVVALSPAFFQTSYSCARGNTFLLSLELEVSGQDQITNFSTTTRSYAVTISSSTAILRVDTQDPASIATYRWFVDGTAIGPALPIGTGGGEVTVNVPDGQSQLYVNVQAPEGAFDSYIVDVDKLNSCDELGILVAIAAGGGPHRFDCSVPTTVTTSAEIVVNNDVILDGEGNLTVDGNASHRVFYVAGGVTAELHGFGVTGGNFFFDGGGGITNYGTLTLTNSTVSGNTVDGPIFGGGGIGNFGTLTLTNSTVSGNTVDGFDPFNGGGIMNAGTATLTNSTVSGNTANIFGGGGIGNFGTLTLTNSTVSGNTAAIDVGGIGNFGTLTLTNTLMDNDCSGGAITSGGGNLESPGDTCGFSQPTDQVNVLDPMLGLLQNNGGLTETHALLLGSPAINHIPADDCQVTEDQRGLPRPGGTMCDVGAFEVEVSCDGVCGDGTTDACEECDDGNNVDDDGCQADCTLDFCASDPIDCSASAECLTDGICDRLCEPGTGCDRCPGKDLNVPDGTVCAAGRGTCQASVCEMPELLETTLGDAIDPQVAVDPNGDAVAVWSQWDGTINNIYANRRTSGVWGTPALLDDGPGVAMNPQVAVDANGDAVVVYSQYAGSTFTIFGNRLTSGVWGPREILEFSVPDAMDPQVAVNPNGDGLLVWSQGDGTSNNIYARRLTSLAWGAIDLLETSVGDAMNPQVAVDSNGDAVVVWSQWDGTSNNIYANRFTSGVWGAIDLLETSLGDAIDPQVAIDSIGDAVAVWSQSDGTINNIYANRFTSGVWGTPVLLDDGPGVPGPPQVAVDASGDAVVVYSQYAGSTFTIFGNRLTSGVWGSREILEASVPDAMDPRVAVNPNGDGVMVWSQGDGAANSIYTRRLTSLAWGAIDLLETSDGDAMDPQVAVDSNGDAVVVWSQWDGAANSIYAESLLVCPFVCGDGITDVCEECDDGNNVDGDGCEADCTLTPATCNFVKAGSDATPQTQTVNVACTWNVTNAQWPFPWELSVSVPTAIIGDSMFTADFDGRAAFPRFFLDILQSVVPGGVATMEIEDLAATVQIRSGATGPDVVLGVDPAAVVPGLTSFCVFPPDQTCAVDGDCIVPPCNLPVLLADVPISTDCSVGGVCDLLGKNNSQCLLNGFCVLSEDLFLPLLEDSGTFTADPSGEVLFGWADQGVTGLTLCPAAAPACQDAFMPDGSYDLPAAIYANPTNPVGIRTYSAGLFLAYQCVMGEDGGTCASGEGCLFDGDCGTPPCTGVGVDDDIIMPTPDTNLISCPIN